MWRRTVGSLPAAPLAQDDNEPDEQTALPVSWRPETFPSTLPHRYVLARLSISTVEFGNSNTFVWRCSGIFLEDFEVKCRNELDYI